MKIFLYIICIAFILHIFVLFHTDVYAVQISSDPQYIVMNFSSMNELNWAASQNEWVNTIKPKILTELNDYFSHTSSGSATRRRAWSTLMEYMNYPLDEPSEKSIYIIKLNRILDLAEEVHVPVFIPLNGFQWWDELPELYNWWDNDGTHTPASFFSRQDNPEDFKKRFIAGYNPENKWNVDWHNYTTPMKWNSRDWGGGGFYLAPPPNIFAHTHTSRTYRAVVEKRYFAIIQTIASRLQKWEKEGILDLFAGITIGTEVSLNASPTSSGGFLPYGYRAIQDYLCPKEKPQCGKDQTWSTKEMQQARQDIVNQYLETFAHLAVSAGIPKQRIYTHVWGDVLPNEPGYVNYANSSINLYSRPGMSFYGRAYDPMSVPSWNNTLKTHGFPSWGAVEYSTDKTYQAWIRGLTNTFDGAVSQGKVLVVYNWGEHKDTPALQAIADFLTQQPHSTVCTLPEVISKTNDFAYAPESLSWSYLESDAERISKRVATMYLIQKRAITNADLDNSITFTSDSTELRKNQIPKGIYSWVVSIEGCNGNKRSYSEPRIAIFPVEIPKDETPFIIRVILTVERFIKKRIRTY